MKTIFIAVLVLFFSYSNVLALTGETNPCEGKEYTYFTGYYGGMCIASFTVSNGAVTAITGSSVTIRWDCNATSGSVQSLIRCQDETGSYSYHTEFLSVTIKRMSNTVGSVTGPTAIICCSTSNVTYCVTTVDCAESYEWVYPAGWTVISGSTNNCITLQPDQSTGGVVKVRAKDFCGNFSQYSSLTVTRPVPNISISVAGASCLCPSSTVTLTADADLCSGSSTYTWGLPFGWTLNSQSGNTANVTTGAVNGIITVTVSTPCGTASGTRLIDYAPTPSAPSLTAVGGASGCVGDGIEIVVNSSYPNCVDSYEWKVNGSLVSNTSDNLIIIAGQTACVKAVNSCGVKSAASCISTSTHPPPCNPQIIVMGEDKELGDEAIDIPMEGSLGVDNLPVESQISIHPNPSSRIVEIVLPLVKVVSALIVDASSRVILELPLGEKNLHLNVSTWASGSYYLVVKTDRQYIVRSLKITK